MTQDKRIESALCDLDDALDLLLEAAAKLGEVGERMGKLFAELHRSLEERKAHDA